MSQLIACKHAEGIIMGADGLAVDVDSSGNLIELQVDRLHPLSPYTAIMNGGAAAGEAMCDALKNFVAEENLTHIDEIHQAALPFLATEYERFMRKSCEMQPIDPIHQLNFILGGYTPNSSTNPFQLYLLWTKRKLPMLDSDEIGAGFTVPRLIRLEHRLNELGRGKTAMDTVVTEVRQAMERRAEQDAEVASPLRYAMILEDGFKFL